MRNSKFKGICKLGRLCICSKNPIFKILSEIHRYSCNVLFGCTGYYSYETPYEPGFPGQEEFKGKVIHPQKWTEEHDKEIVGKKVAIIGSGATAVTILPNIADLVSHGSTGCEEFMRGVKN